MKERDGWTALMFAIDAPNNEALVRLLLAHGASPLAQSRQGVSAVSLARNEGSPAIIHMVEEAVRHEQMGADQRQREDRGHQLLSMASAGDFSQVNDLIAQGVVEFANHEGNTALIFSAAYANAEATLAMISAGFDVRHLNNENHNVFNVAARKDSLSYLMSLLDHYRQSQDYPSVLMELRLNTGHFSPTVERAVVETGIMRRDLDMILHAVRHGTYRLKSDFLTGCRGGRQRSQRQGVHPAALRHHSLAGACRGGAPGQRLDR